ncbi:hypothetical protein BSPWISOXPB_8817 [uncultured Gammaproteobacteria bacterium]|nr:hypothetical protein BSPWISOXPB_8817 [uncultured Gammaproteobacteria bacterium]
MNQCNLSNGANVTAYYHTHGAYDPKYDSEIFSDTYDGRGDIPLQNLMKWMDI